jgi:hypothetical protein
MAIDLIELDIIAYNGHRYVFYAFDLFSKLYIVYIIAKHDKPTLQATLRQLDRAIKREFNTAITFLIANNERGYGLSDDSARAYYLQEGIKL